MMFSGCKEAAARLPSMKKDGSKSQAIVVCDNVVPVERTTSHQERQCKQWKASINHAGRSKLGESQPITCTYRIVCCSLPTFWSLCTRP